jgi:hypothetical protein
MIQSQETSARPGESKGTPAAKANKQPSRLSSKRVSGAQNDVATKAQTKDNRTANTSQQTQGTPLIKVEDRVVESQAKHENNGISI